jgi:hypothetical protein
MHHWLPLVKTFTIRQTSVCDTLRRAQHELAIGQEEYPPGSRKLPGLPTILRDTVLFSATEPVLKRRIVSACVAVVAIGERAAMFLCVRLLRDARSFAFCGTGDEPAKQFPTFHEELQNQDESKICGVRVAATLAERILRTYSTLRRVAGICGLVYLAQSCAEGLGFEATRIRFCGEFHRVENACELE